MVHESMAWSFGVPFDCEPKSGSILVYVIFFSMLFN